MEPTKEQVQTRYENLLSKQNRKNYKKIIGFGLIVLSFPIIVFVQPLAESYDLEYFQSIGKEMPSRPFERPFSAIVAGGIISSFIAGFIIISISGKRIFDAQQKIFFEFYHTYVTLQEFVDGKGDREKKKALKRINTFILYIEGWQEIELQNQFQIYRYQ